MVTASWRAPYDLKLKILENNNFTTCNEEGFDSCFVLNPHGECHGCTK